MCIRDSVKDSYYSHITTEKPAQQKFEVYETLTKAKRELIKDINSMLNEYRHSLRVARTLRKTDFEEEED